VRAAVFVRRSGANGVGHVGWAFDCDAILADCGAVENPSGDPLNVQPIDMGFWTDTSIDPVQFAKLRQYDEVKYFDLSGAQPAMAYGKMLWVAAQPYEVVGRNCLNDVYDVLTTYGVANLPPPVDHWFPNDWFDRVNAPSMPVASFDWRLGRTAAHIAEMEALPTWSEALRDVHIGPPRWVIKGTPEYLDLQQRIRKAELEPPAKS
jgi:hypothetical protein